MSQDQGPAKLLRGEHEHSSCTGGEAAGREPLQWSRWTRAGLVQARFQAHRSFGYDWALFTHVFFILIMLHPGGSMQRITH